MAQVPDSLRTGLVRRADHAGLPLRMLLRLIVGDQKLAVLAVAAGLIARGFDNREPA